MYRNVRRSKPILNEDGISLVEILVGVTIMAIISVTLMGHFLKALDKSAEESRRIIASNLSRLKAAELRDYFKDQYASVETALGSDSYYAFTGNSEKDHTTRLMLGRLDRTIVNGTTYRYLVELDNQSVRKSELDTKLDASDGYLTRMLVTVYWSGDETFTPSPNASTTLDTYLVKRW
ncbi:type IV pilus modification PilV family protein [Paenibacillus cremeus]|uniref:Prepilin-type N-terminal cleavage/methylation domain-containing protein n=1 Tax=Paenibacillus cremeus TaxID=2163881 RepID=A0A559KE56_9BACL|nr:hypothetical protein [Paenibacillus cremeus]TVY10417.1 hypothetical protein FPZ49_08455 [Paenibacillus cremeus]